MGGACILLVGGSGFMGRHAAAAAIAAGHQVAVLSRGNGEPVPGAEMLTGDRGDPAALRRALEGRHFDLTVDFLAFDAADVEHLLMVPYAALGRYVMISSGQVYLVVEGATRPFREEDAERDLIPAPPPGSYDHASWEYGLGKRRAEKVLLALRATHGVRAIALRLPIVQGAGDRSLRLWAWIERLRDGGPVLLPNGDGAIRHVWAGDVARAIVWLAEHETHRYAFYNLAQNDVLTVRDLVARVARVLGVTPKLVECDWADLYAAGFDEDVAPYAGRWASLPDPARAGAEWGFLGTPVDDYLPGVVRWHLEHPPAGSHPGYARRAEELAFAARLGAVAR
jgi:nucleoside-diphosphate-sugar epimerase